MRGDRTARRVRVQGKERQRETASECHSLAKHRQERQADTRRHSKSLDERDMSETCKKDAGDAATAKEGSRSEMGSHEARRQGDIE